jgi:hypothetical protein
MPARFESRRDVFQTERFDPKKRPETELIVLRDRA